MKYIYAILIATLISGNAHACLKIEFSELQSAAENPIVVDPDGVILFLNFGTFDTGLDPTLDFTGFADITLFNDCTYDIDNITLSISGKAREYCFLLNNDEPAICDDTSNTTSLDGLTLVSKTGTEVAVGRINFLPLHNGKKRRKLTVDGLRTDTNDDVSSFVTILGETKPTMGN